MPTAGEHAESPLLRQSSYEHASPREASSTPFVLSNDEAEADADADAHPSSQLSFFDGLSIVLGLEIGAGIFSAPAQVAQNVTSPGAAILIWSTCGLLVWTGAASFIELGLLIPKNGGVQEYLRACYGDFAGFVFTWTWIGICKPASMAVISRVFAEHTCSVVLQSEAPLWAVKTVALLGLWSITMINCMGNTTGVRVANGFLVLKLLTVFSITLLGVTASLLGYGTADSPWLDPTSMTTSEALSPWDRVGNTVTAAFGALYCFSGWESIGFITGDLSNAKRDLPRILRVAIVIVTCSFVGVNVALFLVLPIETVRASLTPVVTLGATILGVVGASVFSIAAAASAMGTMNANVYATAVLCVAATQRHYLPRAFVSLYYVEGEDELQYWKRALPPNLGFLRDFALVIATKLSNLRLERNVPIYPMILNAVITSPYIIIGTIDGLLTFIGVSEYFFFCLCITGLFMMRRRYSDVNNDRHSYRTWTGNLVVFGIVSALIVARGMITNPLQPLGMFIVFIVGLASYRIMLKQ